MVQNKIFVHSMHEMHKIKHNEVLPAVLMFHLQKYTMDGSTVKQVATGYHHRDLDSIPGQAFLRYFPANRI